MVLSDFWTNTALTRKKELRKEGQLFFLHNLKLDLPFNKLQKFRFLGCKKISKICSKFIKFLKEDDKIFLNFKVALLFVN